MFGMFKKKQPVSNDNISPTFVNFETFISDPEPLPLPTPMRSDSMSVPYRPVAFNEWQTGDKFVGGFGPTKVLWPDYWTLRQRSAQLFTENLYARGLIRRLVTNIINTGLVPEPGPMAGILGLDEDALGDWSDDVENRFTIWGKNPELCDWHKQRTFGELQRVIKLEAMVEGDILIVLHQSKRYKLPSVQLISGRLVRTPLGGGDLKNGNKIKHGVEFDKSNRVVAHHVYDQKTDKSKRIPKRGEKSGRLISWLVYGTDKRMDEVRGQPVLSLILQSLNEIDKYRDSTQRKALLNSLFAMQVLKGEDKPGTLPVSGAAVRKDTVSVANDSDGSPRSLNLQSMLPGIAIEEMQTGEKLELLGGQGTDVNFGPFEESIISACAWALEMPPEIAKLAFSANYSASQAGINEFKMFLTKEWSKYGEEVLDPVYVDWLLSEVLLGKITAPGLLTSWRNPSQYEIYGAWVFTEWFGSIKPSTDMFKTAKGSAILIEHAWTTNSRESRQLTGTKFDRNVKKVKRENEKLAEAMRPMLELKEEFTDTSSEQDANEMLTALVADQLELMGNAN